MLEAVGASSTRALAGFAADRGPAVGAFGAMTGSGSDDGVLALPSGARVHCAYVEQICKEVVPALDQVVVLAANDNSFAIALCTLQTCDDPLLGEKIASDVLALAENNGSSATSLFKARSCPKFRNGIARAFAKINLVIAAAGHPDCQIQRCHILLAPFKVGVHACCPCSARHVTHVLLRTGTVLSFL